MQHEVIICTVTQKKRGEMECSTDHENPVYMDYNATTPLETTVLEAIHDALRDAWGNPSSGYKAGQLAKSLIERARHDVAEMIGARAPGDVLFLSGGTEANNMVIFTAVEHYQRHFGRRGVKPHVIISNVEHDSVLLAVRHLERAGKIELSVAAVSAGSGVVLPETVLKEVRPNTCLVSIMLANNEVGVIQVVPPSHM